MNDEPYGEFLEGLRAMGKAELKLAVLCLPPDLRARLARGPHRDRYKCAVCNAFEEHFYTGDDFNLLDPRWIVFGYHEVPKLDMLVHDDQFDGPDANEVYRRCIDIYRAAGWTGVAEEPNA